MPFAGVGLSTLLHFDGISGATVITDYVGKTWNANGNAQLDAECKLVGSASLKLDGTGDYVQSADSADWALAGDFTVGVSIKLNAFPASDSAMAICSQYVDANNWLGFSVYDTGGTTRGVSLAQVISASATHNQTSVTIPQIALGKWYTFIWTRSGNTWNCYQDVNMIATYTSATNLNDLGAVLNIGTRTGSTSFNGWIDDFFIQKGYAWSLREIKDYVAWIKGLRTEIL